MKISKVKHHEKWRIRLDFPYDQTLTAKVRSIPDARWSRTLKAWHIPYSKVAFAQLKELFPEMEIIQHEDSVPAAIAVEEKQTVSVQTPPTAIEPKQSDIQGKTEVEVHLKSGIQITLTANQIMIKLPKSEADIQFIRSFRYARWDAQLFCWYVPNYGRNAERIQKYFAGRDVSVSDRSTLDSLHTVNQPVYSKAEILVVNHQNRLFKIYFVFNQTMTEQLKLIGFAKWNGAERCWQMACSDFCYHELQLQAQRNDKEFRYILVDKKQIQPRRTSANTPGYKSCPVEYQAKLQELRYSKNTVDTYKHMFEEFINYYPDTDIDKITDEMIVDFLRYLVNERNISGSYQNQSINAIKFYFERVKDGQRKIYTIDRPRKEKILPEVLSQEEVVMILNATENLKHKAILMTIYSAGLRVSELINLKLKDIDSNRMQIRVEQAKGKKDRYTLLGEKTLEVLRQYVKVYKPKEFLFEGMYGEQYTRKAIQKFLKTAVDKVGIMKHVTIHTLRHSFATHLLESGTDIRYIQSLLGHSSGKTTEIYTHITTRGVDQIKSPLDRLDIK